MVVVGSALMVALNGLSAGAADFISKQLNFLAPNVIFVSPGQIGFRGGPSAPPTIVFNAEVVNQIKSLPNVQDVVPAYQEQLQLDAQGSIINGQVLATDPTKIYLIAPSMQLIPGSSIQANNPIGMLVACYFSTYYRRNVLAFSSRLISSSRLHFLYFPLRKS